MPDHTRMKIDYVCPGCGAEAASVPDPGAKPGAKSGRVMVPHGPRCPVAARVAEMRARALAGR